MTFGQMNQTSGHMWSCVVGSDGGGTTGQVDGGRRRAERRERFEVELKVLVPLAPGPRVP